MRQALIEGANTKKEARKEGRRSEINYKGNKSLQEEELRITVTVPRERGRTEAAEIFCTTPQVPGWYYCICVEEKGQHQLPRC